MDTEIKKNIYLGEGGSTAEVVEEDKNPRTLNAQYAQTLIGQAGKLMAPIGIDHIGSATVHYYAKKIDSGEAPVYVVVCQTDVRRVNEGHADLGWKSLKNALMKAFGRPEPKMRN